MGIKEFKLTKNIQEPTRCYKYEKETPGNKRLSIITMNGGKSFVATVGVRDFSTKHTYIDEVWEIFDTVKESLDWFSRVIKWK